MRRSDGRLALRTLLDTYGHTIGLKDGTVASPRLRFEFDEVRPIYDGFGRTVAGDDFDLSELALVVWLQLQARGANPWLLLPVGLLNRFHHGSLVHHVGRGIDSPADLGGRAVGVRAYTQTTAAWVRGLLRSEHGVDPASIRWVTLEDGHVPGQAGPASVERARPDEDLETMLLDGRIDAAVVARVRPEDPRIRELIREPEAAALRWYRTTGVLPINHMLVLRRNLADEHPWLVAELARLLGSCRRDYLARLRSEPQEETDDRFRAGLLAHGIDPLPFGVDAVRPALELMSAICIADGIIPGPVPVESMFDPRVAVFAAFGS